jgi:uncharacterized protein YecE (DUF72 family)
MKLYVGCPGWSYTSWKGPLYPFNIKNKLWLPYYSQIFNYVEIDSTFYNIPSELMVRNWSRRTPDSFRFTAKFPKIITLEKRFKNVEKHLELFYERMKPIKDKVLALLIQLLPSYQLKQGLQDFNNYNFFFEGSFRYAVEVRHPFGIALFISLFSIHILYLLLFPCRNIQIENPSSLLLGNGSRINVF